MGQDSSAGAHSNARVREQEVLAELGQQALEADDLDALMHDVTVAVAETLDTEYAHVLELLPEEGEFFLRQGTGWDEGTVGNTTVPPARRSQAGYTLLSEEPVIVEDLRTEDRFSGNDLLVDHDVVSGITVLIGSVENPRGVLGTFTTDQRTFTEADANFVQSVANVLASVIENERAETELEEIYGRISDAFFALDEEWRFTYLNERAHEVINPDGRELVGKNLWEAFPAATERAFKPKYEQAMYEQETVSFEEYYPEPLDAWFEVRAYPSETGLSVYFRDVTDRKEREAELAETITELRENEERLRLALEAGEMGTWELDLQTDESPVRSPQHDRIFGYGEPLEDWDFETFMEHVHPDDREEVQQRFEEAFETGRWDFECRIIRGDGEQRTISAQGKFYYDDGDPEWAVGVVQDITGRKERQRELQRYERIIDALGDPVYELDTEGRFTYVNQAFVDQSGYSADELLGRHVSVAMDEEAIAQAEAAIAELLADDPTETTTLEYEATTKDGERVHVENKITLLTDDDGHIQGSVGVLRDITEREERERRLQESERRYRTLAESFPNGVVTLFDDDLEYTLAAGRAFEYLPVTRDDVEGRTPHEAWDKDVADAIEPLFEAALDGVADSVEVSYVDREWVVHAVPVTDERGDVFAGMTMAQDITEQVEQQAELERALDLLERTERIADVGGWEIDPETQEVFWTDHIFELLEVDADEEPPLDEALAMYHDDDRRLVEDAVEEALETGDPFDVEVRIQTASGELRWLRLQGAPETVDGEVVSFRGAAQDVTERKRREQRLEELVEKLEESNERLEQFAYAASHDLQEPLRMVSSYLQLLERRYGDDLDEDGREFIEFAVDGADRMREMIQGLLQYSRVDTKGDPFEPVDLDAVFADVRQNLQVKIEETEAEITADDLPTVCGDGSQLNQVFQNLLDNAIEYSGDAPSRVHVDAERRGDEWVVSVSDEGVGIDPDDRDRVFEVFQSLHGHDEAGTGIGLALVKRIVERHGGDIWVDSEPGEGATFMFTVPAVDDV